MTLYTKTGDDGTTGLLGTRRIRKDDSRIEAYGTIDELNAVLGIARSCSLSAEVDRVLADIQNDLFSVGSALADPNPKGRFHSIITMAHGQRLEQVIDLSNAKQPELTCFILPGGTPGASQVHLARTVCRRAERLVVKLSHQPGEHVPEALLIYLNRLSDTLFVIARQINHEAGIPDQPWVGL